MSGATACIGGRSNATSRGETYRFWAQDDGGLAGARFDTQRHGDTDIYGARDVKAAGYVLIGDDEDTVANENLTALKVLDTEFSIGALLGTGMASVTGDNIVSKAKGDLEDIRADVAALVNVYDEPADSSRLEAAIESVWEGIGTNTVQKVITRVFGTKAGATAGSTVDRIALRVPDNDEALDELDDLIDALSSEGTFAAATAEDGGGVFEAAGLSADDAAAAFNASESEAMATFGVTSDTRYGAAWKKTRANALQKDDDLDIDMSGAFGYGVIDNTVRTHHVQSAGNAFYRGGTNAVSDDGKFYNGDIEIRVRFATDTVSGLITNFASVDGEPWEYQYGDVDSILLPDSKLLANARWQTAKPNSKAQLTFARRAGSPAPLDVNYAEFKGLLLGKGENSGSHVTGIWSLSDGTANDASLMAGGFGAVLSSDEPTDTPGTDDGDEAKTWLGSSAAAEYASGNLKLTVDEYGWRNGRYGRLGTHDQDSDTATAEVPVVVQRALDGSGTAYYLDAAGTEQSVSLDATTFITTPKEKTKDIGLASLYQNVGLERNTNGDFYRDGVRDAVQKLRDDLAALIDRDLLPDQQTAQWTAFQDVMKTLVFNNSLPPKLDSDYTDIGGLEALDRMDAVLEALGSSSNLDAALNESGGVFTKADGTPFVGRAFGDIWAEKTAQYKVTLGATDYTRFGAWWYRDTKNMQRTDGWQVNPDADSPGSFAYSQLPQTLITGPDSPAFPNGASATYTGETVSVQYGQTYIGTVEAMVSWVDTWTATDNGRGTLNLEIGNLQVHDTGDPLYISWDDGGTRRTKLFGSVLFSNIHILGDTDNSLKFGYDFADNSDNLATNTGGTSVVTATPGHRLRVADSSVADLSTNANTTVAATLDGTFVGQSQDGPLALIGNWSFDPNGTITAYEGKVTTNASDVITKFAPQVATYSGTHIGELNAAGTGNFVNGSVSSTTGLTFTNSADDSSVTLPTGVLDSTNAFSGGTEPIVGAFGAELP